MSKNSSTEDKLADGRSKVERYAWVVCDSPGELRMIPKRDLAVDFSYQRRPIDTKVLRIAGEWSWVGCCVITVAKRADGTLWVIDGSHRMHAALRRDDISHLPCVVFDSKGSEFEAKGFLKGNCNRKPVAALDVYRAAIVAGDKVALTVARVCSDVGVTVTADNNSYHTPKTTRVVSALQKIVREWEEDGESALREILSACCRICQDRSISNTMVQSINHMRRYLEGGLTDRLISRMESIGPSELEKAAAAYVALSKSGGPVSQCKGMLEVINQRLTHKFELKRKVKK